MRWFFVGIFDREEEWIKAYVKSLMRTLVIAFLSAILISIIIFPTFILLIPNYTFSIVHLLVFLGAYLFGTFLTHLIVQLSKI